MTESSDGSASATAAPGSATVPAKIHMDRGAGTLAIEWQDGHASTYDAVGLRWLCPCAFCRGEMHVRPIRCCPATRARGELGSGWA